MTAKAELRNFIQHYGLDDTKEALAEIEEELKALPTEDNN